MNLQYFKGDGTLTLTPVIVEAFKKKFPEAISTTEKFLVKVEGIFIRIKEIITSLIDSITNFATTIEKNLSLDKAYMKNLKDIKKAYNEWYVNRANERLINKDSDSLWGSFKEFVVKHKFGPIGDLILPSSAEAPTPAEGFWRNIKNFDFGTTPSNIPRSLSTISNSPTIVNNISPTINIGGEYAPGASDAEKKSNIRTLVHEEFSDIIKQAHLATRPQQAY